MFFITIIGMYVSGEFEYFKNGKLVKAQTNGGQDYLFLKEDDEQVYS